MTHTPGDTDYTRGYETWLLKEAKARNPKIPTYCLSWTAPHWVGEYLSPAGVEYHIDYMKGVRDQVRGNLIRVRVEIMGLVIIRPG
eukprot:COSAG01_NODE_12501_length_1728_cov_14.324739_2_plen_86_part_00